VFEFTPEIESLLGIVEVVKLDLMQIAPEHLSGLVQKLKKYPVKLLAEKVEDREQAKLCMEMGFDLFQGYHFARPEMLSGKRPNPSKIALVRLLSMMLEDADNDQIEETFKEQADLTYNLMRMVNSAGTGLTTKISSLKHGMMVLGRQPLRRWIQLLLYASNQGNITVSPLMQLAATRGKLLELVAQQEHPEDRDYADRAFMVGMLSLLDTLMGEPLPEILSRMSLHEEVEAALLKHEGSLGELLMLCDNIETGNLTSIQGMLGVHPSLSMESLNKAQLEALGWANKIVL
jgi:EAL and modified HD-GYP domain-containing signal transduction protein